MRTAICMGATLWLAFGCSDGEQKCKAGTTGCDAGPVVMLVVSGVAFNATCYFDWPDSEPLARGLYDVAEAGRECQRPYTGYFRFSTNYAPDVHLVVFATRLEKFEISLATANGDLIAFDTPPLPNPFQQPLEIDWNSHGDEPPYTHAVEPVVLIPSEYRAALRRFAGQKITASFAMNASGDGELDDTGQTFSFPIEICDHCLTVCATQHAAEVSDTCKDYVGADGRVCTDPDC